jgi:hypothetical protein
VGGSRNDDAGLLEPTALLPKPLNTIKELTPFKVSLELFLEKVLDTPSTPGYALAFLRELIKSRKL